MMGCGMMRKDICSLKSLLLVENKYCICNLCDYILQFIWSKKVEINRREQKQLRENELRLKATEAEKRAIQIEHDRKTKELEEARLLQLSMLPKELPQLPNLEIAAFMRTATEVGGDYYDFIVQENGVLNIAFGDATGHGLQAGTMVTLMKGFFTSDSSKLGLKDFMSHCTRVIKDIKLGRILMSFSYLKIDKNKLEIASAGMPPVFYHHRETNQVEEIIIKGMPLGAMRNASYNTVERELKSGDTILLLTDGLPEQMNPNEEMFDYSRVKKHFNEIIENSPNTIIEKLVEAGDGWMNGRVQDDDITLVVIKIK
jgi:serine phosphatase RsbU (regulator of sigma subunit)